MALAISKKRFIEAIENNDDGLTNQELAASLGLSESNFYRIRAKYRDEIKDRASLMAQETAAEQILELRRQSRAGNTKATIALLTIAGVYNPAGKQAPVANTSTAVILLPVKLPAGAPVSFEGIEVPATYRDIPKPQIVQPGSNMCEIRASNGNGNGNGHNGHNGNGVH